MNREDIHEALVQALPVPVSLWQKTTQGTTTWVLRAANPALAALFDPSCPWRVGQRLDEIFDVDSNVDLPARLDMRARVATDRHWEARPLRLSEDCAAVIFESTPEDPASADLSFSTLRFQALLERAFDGIFVRRKDRLVYLNPALLSLLGYEKADDLVGRSVLTFIHPDHHALLIDRIRSTDSGQGSEPPISVRCVRRDGGSVWLDGAGMPAKYQNEWAYLVLVRDVTARREEELALRMTRETLGARLDVKEQELEVARVKANAEAEARLRAEQQLRQAQKMDAVGRLAGGIAHDFNNLLSVILAHSSVLARSLDDGDPRQTSAKEVLAAGQRAADLTRQLLALSRRQVLEPRIVDVNAVVERMISMLSRLVGEQIEIALHLEPQIQATRLDPTQLEQVVLNLVVNARDAMPKGGRLSITTANLELDAATSGPLGTTPGPHILLSVSDTGVGMDDETQARIFEPFFTTKQLGAGIGLGLSTAHGIVRQSGGAIVVSSAREKGSHFFVYLPAAGHRAPMIERAAPRAVIRRGTETILVAEDEPAVRAVICGVLSAAGYRVLVAATGTEAWRMARRGNGSIDLLLSDVVMPGTTGPELAQRILTACPKIRVLMISGYSKQSQLPASMHFLPKPFTDDELLMKVREVLDAPLPLVVDGLEGGA